MAVSKKIRESFLEVKGMQAMHYTAREIDKIIKDKYGTGLSGQTMCMIRKANSLDEYAKLAGEASKERHAKYAHYYKNTSEPKIEQIALIESEQDDKTSSITITGNKKFIEALFKLAEATPGASAGATF